MAAPVPEVPIAPEAERCSGCGWLVSGGTAACQAVFDAFLARDFENPYYGRYHRLMVDTYCVQHPERYCISAKSLAAHLCGLCCAFEHDPVAPAYEALQRWLNGTPAVERPALPSARGTVTIGDVRNASEPVGYAAAVQAWASSAWQAYAILHPVARRMMAAARAQPSPRRSRPR